MDKIFNEQSRKIGIILATETEQDPFEKNVSWSELNPLPIKAIVTDLTFAKVSWAMPGIVTDKAKELIIERKHQNLLELSYKILIDGDYYEGWKINGKMQYRREGNYLRIYCYLKKNTNR